MWRKLQSGTQEGRPEDRGGPGSDSSQARHGRLCGPGAAGQVGSGRYITNAEPAEWPEGWIGCWGRLTPWRRPDMLVALHSGTFGKLRDLFYVHV